MEKKLVICCGMPRSGSTLQYQIAVEILKYSSKGKGIGWIQNCSSLDLLRILDEADSWCVLKTHNFKKISGIDNLIQNNKVLLLYSYRDLRDVVISAARKNKTKTISLMRDSFLDDALENYNFWTSFSKTYIAQYEIMISDIFSEVKRVADYLQIDLEKKVVFQISNKLSLENQRKRIRDFDFDSKGDRVSDNVFDPETLLHNNHIYSATPQQWKKELVPLEVAIIEVRAEKWLFARGYGISQPKYIRHLAYLIFLKQWKPGYFSETLYRAGKILIHLQRLWCFKGKQYFDNSPPI